MSLRLLAVGADDRRWHGAYCAGVRAVFRQADFERWIDWGEWSADYCAFCLVDGERIVANAALTRMQLVVADQPSDAFQIGAVHCLPDYRGQGLARRVLDAALQHCGDTPVLLFGNPGVRDFYPRFGFVAREEQVFGADHACTPAGVPAPALNAGDPAVRARIHALAAQGLPESRRFAARGHGRILTWYCANGFARPVRELAADLLVVAGVEGDTLFIDAVLTTSEHALAPLLPRLIDRPIRQIRFGFTPDRWWSGARVIEVDADSDLFLRGFKVPPTAPHRFPVLART